MTRREIEELAEDLVSFRDFRMCDLSRREEQMIAKAANALDEWAEEKRKTEAEG